MSQTVLESNQTKTAAEVFTLAEAADYLRVSEDAVLAAVTEQQLPGRQIQGEWRFLKAGIQHWLSTPMNPKERLMQFAGAAKDDPYMDEMLENIYKERGRPMVEEEE